jgi:TonB family protein
MPRPYIRVAQALASTAVLCAQSWSARPPQVLWRSEPVYTEEARRAGVNTAIMVTLVVDENGLPRDLKVVRSAGFGLDEAAIRAIETWRFEPAVKEGKPFPSSTHVEIHFTTLDKAHHGQDARLSFGLAPDDERPELIAGEMPSNPEPAADAAFRVRFTVGADGLPKDFQTFESNNLAWTERALRDMADWRFRPAMHAGQPEEATGVFELAASQQAQENRPTLRRSLVPISAAELQDASLPAPKPIAPRDRAVIEAPTRKVTCKWEASPGAVSYLLERTALIVRLPLIRLLSVLSPSTIVSPRDRKPELFKRTA